MARSALLLTAALLLGGLPSPIQAQSLRGRVLDVATREPVPGAAIRLLALDSQQVAAALADDSGFFTVPAPGPGEFLVAADRIGYAPSTSGPVRLRAGGFAAVTISLQPRAIALDSVGVQVEAEDAWLRSSGFYARRQEGMGKYMDHLEIEKRSAGGRMADVLQGISGVRVISDNNGTDVQLRSNMTNVFRGRPQICLPLVFLDGLIVADGMTQGMGRMNLETIRPQDVAGIEIYGEAGAPLQFARGGGACGVVLFWTRSGRSPR
jgi:hypothetical protein